MKRKILKFFKRDFLINQLMWLYSVLLFIVILLLMIGIGTYYTFQNIEDKKMNIEYRLSELERYIDEKNGIIGSFMSEITSNATNFEAMRQYILQSPPDYFDYVQEFYMTKGENIFFPNKLSAIINNYSEIETIDIVLDESDYVIHADRKNKRGLLLREQPDMTDKLYMFRTIREPLASKTVGKLYITFSKEPIASSEQYLSSEDFSSYIFSNNGQIIFSESNDKHPPELSEITEKSAVQKINFEQLLNKEYFFSRRTGKDNTLILVMQSKKAVFKEIAVFLAGLAVIGGLVISLLLVTLQKTFKRYYLQIAQIVEVTQQVSEGDLKKQIDTSTVQLELKDLSVAINHMIKSINQYIDNIYNLEIKQRDAHMKALQAQINPHFLSNTLEYIRMYALSQDQEELADVVYAFSALLRNNISSGKTATLREEVDFCEKYVYLYQMRFPDVIAYHVNLDEQMENLVLPKFILQPIVENYFIHGIDYQRMDNAISIKAFIEDDSLVIQISDNGKGVSAPRLKSIETKLFSRTPDLSDSIGLKNIHERLMSYFGGNYRLEIFSEENDGFTVRILLKREVLEDGKV